MLSRSGGDPCADVDRPWFALPEEDTQVPAPIAWKVRAVDPYGAGPWSDDATFDIVKPTPEQVEEDKGSCTTGPAAPGWMWLLLAPLVARRRS